MFSTRLACLALLAVVPAWTGVGSFPSLLIGRCALAAAEGVPDAAASPTPEPGDAAATPSESAPGAEAQTSDESALAIDQKITPHRINLKLFEDTLVDIATKETGQPQRLGVEDCVHRALAANQDILVAEFEPLKSDADILATKGEFDPLLRGNGAYTYSSQSVSSDIAKFGGVSSVEAYRTNTTTSVSGKLKWGTQYNVSLGMNKEETTYNKFIEEYSGGLTLSLTQPLLRGRGLGANLARIRSARNARLASEQQLALTAMRITGQVIKAYWDLVGAVEQLKVRQQALDNAKRLLDISEKRLNIGAAAAIDVVQAEAGVAARQSDMITGYAQVRNAEDVLKQLLGMTENDQLSRDSVVPVDRPNVSDVNCDETQSLSIAMQQRPEIHSSEITIASAKLERTRASNDLLPEVGITGSVYQGGRNHFVSNVFQSIPERNDNSFSVGVTGSIPLGNRAARGTYQRAELNTRQAEQQLERTKQQIMLDIRLAVRNLTTTRTLVESTKNTRLLQETNLLAEEKRLNLGVTTSYRVLQVQEDLTAAQTQEVQSLIGFEKAVVDLYSAEGTLLPHFGVEVEMPEPEKPIGVVKSLIPEQWR